MKKLLLSCVTLILAVGLLSACTNREMGTVGGAALGGVVGYGVTGGSAAGAAVGAVGGGLVGNAVTR
jgi:osmotically inducible lipoprotein OsmB